MIYTAGPSAMSTISESRARIRNLRPRAFYFRVITGFLRFALNDLLGLGRRLAVADSVRANKTSNPHNTHNPRFVKQSLR